MATDFPAYISFEEAIQRFSIGVEMLARAVEQGRVRAVKVNGDLAVLEEDVKALTAQDGASQVDDDRLPEYIPLVEASERFRLPMKVLHKAVADRIVKAVRINGELAVDKKDAQILSLRQDIWERVRHLEGRPIGINEARARYGLPLASLYRWIESGYIRVIQDAKGRGRGKKRILNEADVAYAHLLRRRLGGKRGRQFFRPELAPPRFLVG